jgi:hypothetical protein
LVSSVGGQKRNWECCHSRSRCAMVYGRVDDIGLRHASHGTMRMRRRDSDCAAGLTQVPIQGRKALRCAPPSGTPWLIWTQAPCIGLGQIEPSLPEYCHCAAQQIVLVVGARPSRTPQPQQAWRSPRLTSAATLQRLTWSALKPYGSDHI